ncbi:MAG: CoA transferase [Myxococcota bacterium]|nr:CoA transferase [Myxococcota bacterium]
MAELPFEGIRVLDLATVMAGPVAATTLGDFGADVIKVEQPGRGDTIRGLGGGPGAELFWLQEGRNKRCVTLDLRNPEGQELLAGLAGKSDVLIESFRPGTMENWNLGPERLQASNPRLVYLRMSGYGQTGPYRERGSFDRIAAAFSGVTYASGEPDRPPVRSGYALADYLSAAHNTFAIAMALYHRDAQGDGRGQVIDLALYEPMLRASEATSVVYDRLGVVRERTGNRHAAAVPGGLYETRDGAWLVLFAAPDHLFRALAEALGQPELADDPRFSHAGVRRKNADAIEAIIADWAAERSADEALERLLEFRVAAGRVNSIAEVFADPQVAARENLVSVPDGAGGEIRMVGVLPKLSRTPGRIRHAGRPLGADNEEVFGELLGLDAAEVGALHARGVV